MNTAIKNNEAAAAAEAAKMTDKCAVMIEAWLRDDYSPENIERTARWMRDKLRLGGIRQNRAFVNEAIDRCASIRRRADVAAAIADGYPID